MTLGNNSAGLLLALLTALFWGALPLAVKHVLPVMDAVTLVWLRFCVAAVWIWCAPAMRGAQRSAAVPAAASAPAAPSRRRTWLLLAVATAGLGANFVFFNSSVAYLSASACQILAQAGPVLLLLGGVLHPAGSLPARTGRGRRPAAGRSAALLQHPARPALGRRQRFLPSACCWGAPPPWSGRPTVWPRRCCCAHLTPTRILRVIYPCCALGLAPLATPADILRVDAVQLICLIFACINTLVAYGSFTKAMSIWHAAKVSAVVATTPLFSLALESLLHSLWPEAYPLDSVGLLSLLGACTVVLGALGIAVGPMLHLPHLPHLPRRR